MENKKYSNLSFLSPLFTIKNEHLTKQDVKNIKQSISQKIGFSSLFVGIVISLMNVIFNISMGMETGWNQVEKYGLSSLLGQIVSIIGATSAVVLIIISLISKQEKIKYTFVHIGNSLLYITLAGYLFLSFHADASMGFLSETPTLSASVALVSLLLLVQPAFWIEAIVYNGIVSLGLIGLSFYFTSQYNMQALMYYLFIAVIFPISCYLIVTILFYAETQKYCEEIRNGILYNSATYDALTSCKNRHALKEKIDHFENSKDLKLLVMIFDIDDFKLYNDQFSHIGGDYCLKSIADSVRKAFPSPGLDFYRYGGEEFLLFLEIDSLDDAKEAMEKTRLAVSNLNLEAAKGAPCKNVTISVGGTFAKANEITDFNEVIKKADQYLYKAKASGKNVSVLDDVIIERK